MALIGAADGKQKIEDGVLSNHKEILQWAFEKGACLLFSFKHEPYRPVSNVSHYSHNVSMLRGPGEVSKGTFNTK